MLRLKKWKNRIDGYFYALAMQTKGSESTAYFSMLKYAFVRRIQVAMDCSHSYNSLLADDFG